MSMGSVTSLRAVRTNLCAYAFACGVRGGILQTVMPASVSTASKMAVNWPARVPDQDLELVGPVAKVHEQIADLPVVQGPSGLAVTPRMCTYRLSTSRMENTCNRWRVSAQSTWMKSQASIMDAWVDRNRRQVVVAAHRSRWDAEPFEDATDGGRADLVPEAA
jgi:hypothetical protein